MSKIDKRSTKRIRTKLWFKYTNLPPQSPSVGVGVRTHPTPSKLSKTTTPPPLHLRVPASLPKFSSVSAPPSAARLVGSTWSHQNRGPPQANLAAPRACCACSFITIRGTHAHALLHHLHVSCCPPVYCFSSKNVVEVCDLVADFSLSLRSCISAVCEACVRLLPPTFS
jgi:hypothetical protein